MIKRSKRYIFCVDVLEHGRPSEPVYLFFDTKQKRFVLGDIKRKARHDTRLESLRLIVSENPEDFRTLEYELRKSVSEHPNFIYTVKKVFPIKCDSLNCRYLVSTTHCDKFKIRDYEFKASKFFTK